MKRIPARPDIGHLKKQAKDLLALYRADDPRPSPAFATPCRPPPARATPPSQPSACACTTRSRAWRASTALPRGPTCRAL
jgi:hypothetical protein